MRVVKTGFTVGGNAAASLVGFLTSYGAAAFPPAQITNIALTIIISADGRVSVFCGQGGRAAQVIIDVNGYFQ